MRSFSSTPVRHPDNLIETFDPRWVTFGGLGWAVQPGTYTLTFEPVTFFGYMPTPSPNKLAVEWNRMNGGWNRFSGVDGLGIRVEVTAVPEPATWLLFSGACAAALGRRALAGRRTLSA
jgi:hypothetical protein